MIPSRIALGLGVVASVVSLVVACGSSDTSEFGNDPNNPNLLDPDGSFGDSKIDAGDLYANDPLPKYCIVDGGPTPPPPPTGTEQCPSDKNKPGCGCDTVGQTAPCWTGLRANRNLGICKDGVTTCQQVSENTKAWGPCQGEVLPVPGAKGKQGCSCFSEGVWAIANLVPCFIQSGGPTGPYGAFSSHQSANFAEECPNSAQLNQPPYNGAAPYPPFDADHWSTDTLKVDCSGHFTLCYELKAGDFAHPAPSDCSISKVCVESDYPQEGVVQPFPNVPPWHSENSACIAQFAATGGYGEMTVKGISVICDAIDDGSGNSYVFNRVKYCPLKCNDGQHNGDADCQGCATGASGQF